ncbi:MAG: hypothetical protein JWM16_5209 [Verrucomicrobiales bacterium]|nr:hypothetical protein [Verrucomicrobiales bacterium]
MTLKIMKMDVTEQRNQFVELRSKGWPITKIAQSLDLPVPLLCVWLSAEQVRISHLRRRFQGACEQEDLACKQAASIFGEAAAQPTASACGSFKEQRMHKLPSPALGILKRICARKHSPEQN